jgi:hypothetical protein
MKFNGYILQSYEETEGVAQEANLKQLTKDALVNLFNLGEETASLTREEKKHVKVFSGAHRGRFKIFVLVPFADRDRVSKALAVEWQPPFLTRKDIHVLLEDEPDLVPPV